MKIVSLATCLALVATSVLADRVRYTLLAFEGMVGQGDWLEFERRGPEEIALFYHNRLVEGITGLNGVSATIYNRAYEFEGLEVRLTVIVKDYETVEIVAPEGWEACPAILDLQDGEVGVSRIMRECDLIG